MRRNVIVLTLLCMLMSMDIVAQQTVFADAQTKAQRVIMDYLRSNGYAPSIDTKDQSVCYKKGEMFYWITIEGSSSPLLYTIHHRSIKFSDNSDHLLSRKREIAEKAASMVCAEKTVKAYMNGAKVDFVFPMYASTPEEFTKVLFKGMGAFKNIRKSFDDNYKKGKIVADSIHNFWSSVDTTSIVVPQKSVSEKPMPTSLTIKNIEVRVLASNGRVLSDYNEGIRKSRCEFLQEKIFVTSSKAGLFRLGVKLYSPEGKVLLPSKDSKYTTITVVDVPKANKQYDIELQKFGSEDMKVWKAGEYKIEFYEDDQLMFTDAINIL